METLFAGIKVSWDKSIDVNIAGYIIERQESTDGINWGEDWTVIAKTDAITYIDSPLDLDTFYRYRIKAFTRMGVEGDPSIPTTDSIKPKRIILNDIMVGTITADKLFVTELSAICANLGTVTAGIIHGTRFYIGAGTNEDIYWVDSGIRMYDNKTVSGVRGITWKYGTQNFAQVIYTPTVGGEQSQFYLATPNYNFYWFLSNVAGIATSAPRIDIFLTGNVEGLFNFYETGQLGLHDLGSNPGNDNVGQLCSVNGVLKYHNGVAWKTVVLS